MTIFSAPLHMWGLRVVTVIKTNALDSPEMGRQEKADFFFLPLPMSLDGSKRQMFSKWQC